MTPISSVEEFKQIQVDILLAIDKFCKEHNIKYSLACGTLLGAIRHKGFIPWDDDIDIYLLREDYNKLVAAFPSLLDEKYSLNSLERNPLWNRPYAKAFDTRTIEVEAVKSNIPNMGIGIDVFPIDEVPDNETEWKHYEKRRLFLLNCYTLKTLTWRKGRSLAKNIFALCSSVLLFPWSFRKLAEIIDKYCQIHNNKGYHHLSENCLGWPGQHSFKKQDMEQVVDIPFEQYTFKAMIGYDDYLTSTYGDYMQLPPKEKQVSHHVFEAYWK